MARISLYDIFTGSEVTKWLENGPGIGLGYSADYHSVVISLSGEGIPVDISLDPNPTLGGDLNLNGYAIISNPGQDIVIQPGTGGQVIIDGLTWPDSDGDAGDLLGTDGNGNLVWYKVPGISNSQPGLTYYVDQSVVTTGDGSKEAPFQTFQEALDVVEDDDMIVFYQGTYTGDYTMSHSISLKAIDGQIVKLFGKITVPLTFSLSSSGIDFENNVDQMIDNAGSFTIENGSLTREDQNGVTNDGTMALNNVLIKTWIVANSSIEMTGVNSDGGLVTTHESLIIHSATKAPMVDHQAGDVTIRNCPLFDFDDENSSIGLNNSIKSTADTGTMLLDNISLKQTVGWSHILKTGECEWVINNVGRNPLEDILEGERQYFITEASDLSSYYNPVNYAIPSNVLEERDVKEASITDHLIGIDAKLGQSLTSLTNVLWVAGNGNDTNSGSYNSPYKTLAFAVSEADSGDTIIVGAGTYDSESVVVSKDVFINGFGEATLTNSSMQIVGSANLQMDHIRIISTGVALTVNDGSFKISNSYFESPTDAILVSELSADSELIDSNWNSVLHNSDTSGHKLVIRGVNSPSSTFVIDGAGSKTFIRDSAVIGHVQHDAGYLAITNVGQVTADGSGESITSTADDSGNNFLYLNLISTKQDDGTYGKIEKTGDCDYQLGINDFGDDDNFNGDGEVGLITSDQVKVMYDPVSYTSTDILTDHIAHIDELLNQALIRPTRLYYVDDVDELNDIYMSITETTFGYDSSIYITPGAIAQFMLHDDFEFKPGINLIGTGSSENVIVQMPQVIPNLVITSATSGMVHETLWRDIKLNSPTIVNMTLGEDELHYENMTINGDITVNSGRLIIRSSEINGVITVAGGELEIWDCDLLKNVVIGDGKVYINGVKQIIDEQFASFEISGGNVKIFDLVASNEQEHIFNITGGNTIVSTLIVEPQTFDTVINQDIGGRIYLGINNLAAENKTVSGTVTNLGFGV